MHWLLRVGLVCVLFWVFSTPKTQTINYYQLLETKDAVLIDVRTRQEFQEGSIPNFINVPLGELKIALRHGSNFQAQHGITKDQKIILSCRSGHRSANGVQILKKLGYKHVYSYSGGYSDWTSRQNV
ncbi:Rhodanese-like domain-containing protein [Gorgonomyces haynaldii]|nr:Rhodanese-like domain-containing protein [Gorgonomyces haynaldii]